MTGQTKDFSKLKKSISYAFNKKFKENSILDGGGDADGKNMKA